MVDLIKTRNSSLGVSKLFLLILIATVSGSTALYGSVRSVADSIPGKKEVQIGVVVLDISDVDNLEELISTEFIIFLTWQDTSMVMPGQSGVRMVPLDLVN